MATNGNYGANRLFFTVGYRPRDRTELPLNLRGSPDVLGAPVRQAVPLGTEVQQPID